jgi:hypothetical protein
MTILIEVPFLPAAAKRKIDSKLLFGSPRVALFL